MADIFISYKAERRGAIAHITRILENHGFTVWYALLSGSQFVRLIEREIRDAKAVLVLWCSRSVRSDWVLEEASLAKDLGNIIPVKAEAVELPFGFRRLDTFDLTGWDGSPRSSVLDELLLDIGKMVGRDPQVTLGALVSMEREWRRYGQPSFTDFALEATGSELEERHRQAARARLREETESHQADADRRIELAAKRLAEATEREREAEEQRDAAEADRQAEAAREAEIDARLADEERLAAEEERRAAEADRQAEAAREAEKAVRVAEAKRLTAENKQRAREARRAASARRADEAREAQEAARAEERRRQDQEAARLARERRNAEAAERLARMKRQVEDEARLAEEQRQANETARVARERQALEEAARLEEEKTRAEALRRAQEAAQADQVRRQREWKARLENEKREAEAAARKKRESQAADRLAEQKRQAEHAARQKREADAAALASENKRQAEALARRTQTAASPLSRRIDEIELQVARIFPNLSTKPADPPKDPITRARAMLASGDVKGAADLLAAAPACPGIENARAVCALRLGNPATAIRLLRPAVLPDGARVPAKATPDTWILTYATALAMSGDPGGAARALEWVKGAGHPGLKRVHGALDNWRKSLTVTEAARYRLTGTAPRPVKPNFAPGEL
jgi:hypothetical protein